MVSFNKVTLDTVCDVLNGDRGINYPSSSDLVLYGIPFINAGAIENRNINFKKVDFITESKYNSLSGAKFEKGDIVFCLRGSLGKYAMLKIGRGAPASSLAVLRCKSNSLNNKFLFQLLGSEIIEKQILSENNGSSQPNLSAESVKRFLIPLPGITEQIAISGTLSDVDSLISSLQKLIEKKKAIKQGTMQELLTGKKRLPGFYGEWRTMQIGETLSIGHGQSQKAVENRFGKYPILATSGCIGCANDFLWNKPSVLIGRKGTIDKPQYADYPFWTIDTLLYTKIFDGYDAKFIYYKFCMIDWQQYNEASGVPSLNASTIENLHIVVPEKDEQQAIAQVLSDMDSEIEKLEKKLAKYQQIKQGMMQELLTGRIRITNY